MHLRGGLLAAMVCVVACGPTVPGYVPDDAAELDAPIDAGLWIDAPVPPDAVPDAAQGNAMICEPCASDPDCADGWLCILTGVGYLCLPQCSVDMPDCPDDFVC